MYYSVYCGIADTTMYKTYDPRELEVPTYYYIYLLFKR